MGAGLTVALQQETGHLNPLRRLSTGTASPRYVLFTSGATHSTLPVVAIRVSQAHNRSGPTGWSRLIPVAIECRGGGFEFDLKLFEQSLGERG